MANRELSSAERTWIKGKSLRLRQRTPHHIFIPSVQILAPTIALENGQPAFSIGSPGGSTIITTVLQTIVNYVDLRMSISYVSYFVRRAVRR